MNNIPTAERIIKAAQNVTAYFEKHLSNYTLVDIMPRTLYPDDKYLFFVIAKNNTSYTVWSCWNDDTKSLNHGHYAIETLEECYRTICEIAYN